MRFLWQWLTSEVRQRSVIPVAFWYFSLAGGALLLVYALHREDPVFIVGQAAGLLVYSRNLYLIRKERRSGGAPPDGCSVSRRRAHLGLRSRRLRR